MTRDQVHARVVVALGELQASSGQPAEAAEGTTRPIGDLTGFDSHAGLEFTCAIEVSIGIDVPIDENLCVDDARNRARTVAEIVGRIMELQKGT